MVNTPTHAAGIIYKANGKVLLMKRVPTSVNGGTWAFPGGKIENGETAQDAAVREFFEETGMEINGGLSQVSQNGVITLFACEGVEFTPRMNDEHTEFTWATLGHLPEPLHPAMDMSCFGTGMDYADTARKQDFNGWYEIKKNPLSKVGVFPYLGKSIDPKGVLGLEPDKIYQVYRPEAELSDPECIESFKLIPWVVGHTMLGGKRGCTPAEQKGVQGVIGEDVFFEYPYLYGNIKWFSDSVDDLLDEGVKDLSAGFRCKYEKTSGVWNGIAYDVIQRTIRGNHLALVPEGRMGPEVAVLDEMTFTFDAKEIKMADGENKEGAGEAKTEMTLAEVTAALKTVIPEVQKLMGFMAKLKPLEEAEHGEALDAEEAAKKEADEKAKKEKEGEGMDSKEFTAAMDSANKKIGELTTQLESFKKDGLKSMLGEIAARDALASQLSSFVGVFDHAEKTLAEVAAYGAEKLGIKCEKGHEVTAVQAYLQNRKPETMGFGLDAAIVKDAGKEIDAYFNGDDIK